MFMLTASELFSLSCVVLLMLFTDEEMSKQHTHFGICLVRLVPKYCRDQLDEQPLTAKDIGSFFSSLLTSPNYVIKWLLVIICMWHRFSKFRTRVGVWQEIRLYLSVNIYRYEKVCSIILIHT